MTERIKSRSARRTDTSRGWSVVPGIDNAPLQCARADATYLVTGGLGGLGLAVAEWLIKRGARHLVLIGRSGASEAVGNRLCEWERMGARAVVERADVSNRDRMANIFDIDRTLPPLRGIVHSAGVLDDGILLRQNWQRFRTVMRRKSADHGFCTR